MGQCQFSNFWLGHPPAVKAKIWTLVLNRTPDANRGFSTTMRYINRHYLSIYLSINFVLYVKGNCQWRSQEFDLGVYVLSSHCNFKTCVNVPHVNKTVTDFGGVYTHIPPHRYASGNCPAGNCPDGICLGREYVLHPWLSWVSWFTWESGHFPLDILPPDIYPSGQFTLPFYLV